MNVLQHLLPTSEMAGDSEGLPSGWVGYKDKEGRPYYHNAAEGKTEWTRPASASATTPTSATTPDFLQVNPETKKNRRRKWDTGADGTPAVTPAGGGASAPIHGSAVDAAKAAAALIAEKLNGTPDKKRKWDVPAAGAR